MSYWEAIEDGIQIRKLPHKTTAYAPPCVVCGKPSFTYSYVRGKHYTCRDCKARGGIHRILNRDAQNGKLST